MNILNRLKQPLKHLFVLLFVIAIPFTPASAISAETKTVEWSDLVAKIDFEDPFLALDQNQISALRRYSQIKTSEVFEDKQEAIEIENILEEQGITEVKELLSKRHEIAELRKRKNTEVNPALNGRDVRLAGYMLPLEFDEHTVTEFLLVPWVGACIHTPPPPPNQMIRVVLKHGVEFKGLYEPVWLSGELEAELSTQELYLVDGSASVDMGYTMKNGSVQKYR